jgi:hypothetical protein
MPRQESTVKVIENTQFFVIDPLNWKRTRDCVVSWSEVVTAAELMGFIVRIGKMGNA